MKHFFDIILSFQHCHTPQWILNLGGRSTMLFGTKLKRWHSPDLYVPHGVHIVRKYDGRVVAGLWQGRGRAVKIRFGRGRPLCHAPCHAVFPSSTPKSDFLPWQNCWKFAPAKSNMCVAGLWQVCGIGRGVALAWRCVVRDRKYGDIHVVQNAQENHGRATA